MSIGDVLAIEVIAVVGVLLLIGTIIPGVRLYWPRHHDPVSRSDLGVALMGGALIAFAVLVLQVLIQFRSETDARERQEQAEHAALLLVLGQSPNLSGLDLSERDLSEAYLNGKVLRGAVLAKANMSEAQAQDAVLAAADLSGADLLGARLDRADLRYANLADAKLAGAHLRGVTLDSASLVRADLSGADLSHAWIRADLRDADLTGAKLIGSRLAPANLAGATFSGANLELADLRGADLKGADLGRAQNLQLAKDLSFAKYDETTKWPSDFTWGPEDQAPTCGPRVTCTLSKARELVQDLPKELVQMRAKLERVMDANSLDCLPGWWVDERGAAIDAHAPGERATFTVSMEKARGRTARAFATGYLTDGTRIPRVRVAGASSAYAERFLLTAEGRRESGVGVYYVNGSHAYRLWGWASPEDFPLFQRDFVKLFRVMGVGGDLFPRLRGGKEGCRA